MLCNISSNSPALFKLREDIKIIYTHSKEIEY